MIYVLSGGQTGATLTVTSSGAGTITVSNATLGKSYSKSVTAGGSVVFKGLQTGTWTVKITDGTKTSTKTITITSDYSTSISYFSATISITYPAKSTCVVKNSSGTTIASNNNTGSSTKTWTATVNATGTYTVTATATDGSGKTRSTTVSITADGQSKSVTLTYELVLFDKDAGINRTDLTGGFELYDGYVGFSKYLDSTGGYGTMSGRKVADIANHSVLVVETGDITAPQGAYMGIAEDNNTSINSVYDLMTSKVSIDSNGIYSLDISSITSSAYIALCCYNNGAGSIDMAMRAKRIYLQ